MANTYSQLYVHIVFAVKGRECVIREQFREELQKYITGIVEKQNQKLYAIYCMPDHTHIFVSIKPSIAISELVRDIKANSSTFIKNKKWIKGVFSWQEGFGVFSYHKSLTGAVINYIINQPTHYKKLTFKEEYLAFLKKFEIEYDEKYLFDFYD